MPQVRMLTAMSGPDVSLAMGDVIEVDVDTAARFIAAEVAEAVATEPKRSKRKVDTATNSDPVETAEA